VICEGADRDLLRGEKIATASRPIIFKEVKVMHIACGLSHISASAPQ
jgi:hypothetical protein